ncbi:hypothetical protein [Nonomuraea sp. NPDC052265]|uniref:hypothetical protein n=1 Tax=Nonomuraea sp. NPDC052265 TaxID=3364374 RepID=UPI0037CB7F91
MTRPHTGVYTEAFREQHGTSFTGALAAAVAAARAGDFTRAATAAARLRAEGGHLQHSVVCDALAAGLDWWALGEVLAMHPQTAFEAYANLLEGTRTPAQQRPALAVVCTAGLVCAHDMGVEEPADSRWR